MKRTISLFMAILLLVTMGSAAFAAPTGVEETWYATDWATGGLLSGGAQEVSSQTYIGSSGASKKDNVALAANAINGTYISYGQVFSFNDIVGPRTAEYGYKNAPNGRGANVRGGGVSQVATTIYLALKQLSGITYKALSSYGDLFTDNYVSNPADSVMTDYAAGKDFAFINYAGDMRISIWTTYSYVYCTIEVYGANGGIQPSENYGTMIGYASTPVTGTSAYKNNLRIAAEHIDQKQFSYNQEFSFNTLVGPRTERYGYGAAVNGRGVKVIGGGVAQVASTVYLAVKKLDAVALGKIVTYGKNYNQNYVSSADDAIVTDYNGNIDLSFRYTGKGILTLRTYLNSSESRLICEVYVRESWA